MRCLKKLIFRIKHGFWASDLWSLDCSIAKFVLPRLKNFRENLCGYPGNDEMTLEKWEDIIDSMIFSLDHIVRDLTDDSYCDDCREWDAEKVSTHFEKVQHGCELFGKYFQNLWD